MSNLSVEVLKLSFSILWDILEYMVQNRVCSLHSEILLKSHCFTKSVGAKLQHQSLVLEPAWSLELKFLRTSLDGIMKHTNYLIEIL